VSEKLAPERLTQEALESALELQDRIKEEMAREAQENSEGESKAGLVTSNETEKQNG